MKTVTIAEFKANFSSYAEEIEKGEEIVVTRGRKRKKIFRISPFRELKPKKRKLGILNGKVKVKFAKDFKMSTEEFLGS
jgi:antitoxin (DNA-binding transcriptional repressor) of toxin-antitoxin stability system